MNKIIAGMISVIVLLIFVGTGIVNAIKDNSMQICDGVDITENCKDSDGKKYAKYLNHDATEETTKVVNVPAVTHEVNHPAIMGTRQVRGGCITTNISYKGGSCALSQCRDGSYSGSTGRGTCSYHGGVARSGGPWYEYTTETYTVKPAWTETVIDTPATTKTVVDSLAKPAYTEKIPI